MAAVTVRTKLLEVIPFCVAVILLEPVAAPVARPAALMLTVAGLEEAHVAVCVRSCVLPSVKVPVAVNCRVVPFAIEELTALTLMDCNVAAVTVRANVFDVIPPCVAVILLDPTAAPVANPLGPIVTVAVFEEDQVALFVRFWVLPSLNVPVAVN